MSEISCCTICHAEFLEEQLTTWENFDTGEKHRLCPDCNDQWELELKQYKIHNWQKTVVGAEG